MAHEAAVACMKSGMAMMTASMFLPSLSSIWRKSLYFGKLSYLANMRAAFFESTSHSATMFSDSQPVISLSALPPAPMEAMFSFSFGDLYPRNLREGVLPNPAAGTAPASRLPKKKCLRDRCCMTTYLYHTDEE